MNRLFIAAAFLVFQGCLRSGESDVTSVDQKKWTCLYCDHPAMRTDHPQEDAPGASQSLCEFTSAPLSEGAHASILRALAHERRAASVSEKLQRQFGTKASSHFAQLAIAERRHVKKLEQLLSAHQIPVTPDERGPSAAYESLPAACNDGLNEERVGVLLYEELLREPLPSDVSCVFSVLRTVSIEHQLPLFERCSVAPSND